VVGVLVDDTHRTDDCATAQTEIIAPLARVLLAVQRVGHTQSHVVASYSLHR